MPRSGRIGIAGSLRIETFEGGRPCLRRTREGYGYSIDVGSPRSAKSVGFDVLQGRARAAVDAGKWRPALLAERSCVRFWGSRQYWHTLVTCVPKQASGSAMTDCYEVSAELSLPTDLRRIC